MAEEYVVKEQLDQEMIEGGAQVILKLDEIGFPVTAALWFLDDEVHRWDLIVASPDVASKGPLYGLRKIREALESLEPHVRSGVPFSVMSARTPDAPPIRWIREDVHTGKDISRIRFRRRIVAGQFIDDALIYRMT